MLTRELQSQSLPYLHLHDSVHSAIQLMNEYHVTHLPVVEGEKYIGIVSEDDLLLADDENQELETLQQLFSSVAVRGDEHFLKAIQVAAENNLSVVPVVASNSDISGAVAYSDLLKEASDFMSLNEPGGMIVLEMETNRYSFNEISKLVETNDAQITQLNTTNDAETGTMEVTIRVNKPDISDIVATLQRYDYNIKYYFGEEHYVNELRNNYDNLMNYLKI